MPLLSAAFDREAALAHPIVQPTVRFRERGADPKLTDFGCFAADV
jgi:hypothetical protein